MDFFNLRNPSSRTVALEWTPGIFLGVKSGRRVGLTTLPPSVSRMSENMGASTSRNPKGLHGLYRDNFIFTFFTINSVTTESLLVRNFVVKI
jgi:hypothetical protein